MKYIFVGGFWNNNSNDKILATSRGSIQYAANEHQLNILYGLKKHLGLNLNALTCRFIGSFPKRSKSLVVKKESFTVFDDLLVEECGFINAPLFKNISKVRRLLNRLLKISNCKEETVVIGYSMTYSIVKTLFVLKKKRPNVKICLIVPDLPEFMSSNPRKSIFKKVVIKQIYEYIKVFDCFVTLTDQMFSKLKVPNAHHCVVDGIISQDRDMYHNEDSYNNAFREKMIAYTGTLEERYGVKNLIEAFEKINETNIKLVICGYGELSDYVKEKSSSNSRIIFLGSVTVEKARDVQRKAYLLVNPRENQEFVKYSFPSKTFEYMLSGRPVLMYKLDCLSEEYSNYVYFVDGGLRESIIKTMSIDSSLLSEKGKRAQEYVLKNKNAVFQTKKIVDMIKSLSEK